MQAEIEEGTTLKALLELVTHALDRLADGESFNDVVESTGVTARVAELRSSIDDARSKSVSPGASSGQDRPMRADYERAARMFAEAYGKHADAPEYLPRTAQAAIEFKPDAWVVAAMMQAYYDGCAAGETREGIRLAAVRPPDGFVVAQYEQTGGHPVTVDRVTKRDGSVSWAVRSLSSCLSRDGTWEPEPAPSARDDAFLERCRFGSAKDAINALHAAKAGGQAAA